MPASSLARQKTLNYLYLSPCGSRKVVARWHAEWA